jgi:hypothetical protein
MEQYQQFNYGKSRKYLTTAHKLKDTVLKYGVAIIPNVIDENECNNMLSGMWDYIEHITQKWQKPNKVIDRNDKSTWREYYKLLPLHSMLMQYYGVGHAQVAWTLRENPKIVDIFAELWNCKPEELLVSFDGMSFSMPPEETNRGYYRPKKSDEFVDTPLEDIGAAWLHTDQSYTNNKFMCVQSWVTALDVNEGDATLFVLESSNNYHEEFAKTNKITNKDDWYKLSDTELKFYLEKECDPVRIVCGKGDMVFWDSRTIHCGCESIKGRDTPNFRAVVYLCYLPRMGVTEAELKKKKKAFEELRTTKHNPQKSLLFGKKPRDYGNPTPDITPIIKPQVGKLGMKLAGY